VFAEIGMDPANYLLSFARLAPIQVATHGHASTTGVPSIEYFVSYAPFELPEAQTHYSEKLVTFSDFSPYYKPEVCGLFSLIFKFALMIVPCRFPRLCQARRRCGRRLG
jgi:hypothetical protein